MDTKLDALHFGYRKYPDDLLAVWGARLIFPNDLVWDRQDLQATDDDAKQALIAWLNGPNSGDGAIAKMREILRSVNQRYKISPDLGDGRGDDEHVIYEDDEGKIVGSPQSSGGYLYVAGWLKAHTKEG